MPTFDSATVKVVYDEDSEVILGAQIISKTDLTQLMNTMSVVIQPHFNKPWSLLNIVALNAK